MKAALAAVLLGSTLTAAHAETLAYITEQGVDSVAVVDIDAWRIVEQVKVGRKPAGVAVAPGGELIFVSNPESATVSALKRGLDGRHHVVAEVKAGQGPLGLATDREGKLVFVADWYNDDVRVLDAASLHELRVLKVGRSPSGMTTSPDNRLLFVANRESDTVSVIDLTNWRTVATIPVGEAPFGLSYDESAALCSTHHCRGLVTAWLNR
jgi:YVTN family beta-propeller protein